ncbi:unnamed protein product [Dovyalis caffra]|uniref:Uncharacterized protein n=1 Tax=Dovyalis caffra TaxID=77055 RepID=A0AAV1RSM3_9ROSI|nr:unnamed protein product [Dovyalis caffra]
MELLVVCISPAVRLDWIRLQREIMQVGAQKIQEDESSLKESTGVLGEEVILCKQGHCTSTMKNRVSRPVSKKSAPHWLPRIHEDYCALGITNLNTIRFSSLAGMTDLYFTSLASTDVFFEV